MKIACQVLVAAAVFALSGTADAKSIHHRRHGKHGEPGSEEDDAVAEADALATQVNQEESTKTDAHNAKMAADTAKQAAVVANNVATHSVKVTTHAKSALKHALHALHDARVTSELDGEQDRSLTKAESKLKEATRTAEYGKLQKLETEDSDALQKNSMKHDMAKGKQAGTELEQMRKEVRVLRAKLKKKGGDAESDKDLAELEAELDQLEKDSASGKKTDAAVNDELKAEIERLREEIEKEEKREKMEGKELMRDVKMKPLAPGSEGFGTPVMPMAREVTPVEEKGIDIDTAMPYGDLEPFGREDTAQELTEASVRESDMMVDQLERAEVAEEKRAVFRALTRLRGAAITSFDGVARSQTGNIDEYNKIHKWRKSHPLHHLADEESDITKWAFPDNADLLQKSLLQKADAFFQIEH